MEIKHRIELVSLLKEMNLPLIASESGVAEGNFSRDMLEAGVDKLYAIDNWDEIIGQLGDGGFDASWHQKNFKDAMEKFEPYMGKVRVLKGLSYEVCKEIPDGELSLAYIDCDHSYMGVMRDLFALFPKVRHGGIISGHDFLNPSYGVKRAVEDFTRGKYDVYVIPENNEYDASFYFIKK